MKCIGNYRFLSEIYRILNMFYISIHLRCNVLPLYGETCIHSCTGIELQLFEILMTVLCKLLMKKINSRKCFIVFFNIDSRSLIGLCKFWGNIKVSIINFCSIILLYKIRNLVHFTTECHQIIYYLLDYLHLALVEYFFVLALVGCMKTFSQTFSQSDWQLFSYHWYEESNNE